MKTNTVLEQLRTSRCTSNTNKTPLPEMVKVKMDAWRDAGNWAPVPAEYVQFHKDLAYQALPKLVQEHGLTVHKTWEGDQGWMDGMNVLYAIIEERSGRLVKLSWHDSNQEFFEHGSGSWPYRQ